MTLALTRICQGCKAMVPMEKMRYVMKGSDKLLVCEPCFEKLTGKTAAKLSNAPSAEAPKQEEKKDMMCSRCNYSFKLTRNTGMNYQPKCPYCGKNDRLNTI